MTRECVETDEGDNTSARHSPESKLVELDRETDAETEAPVGIDRST
jgi:hypothetical protein